MKKFKVFFLAGVFIMFPIGLFFAYKFFMSEKKTVQPNVEAILLRAQTLNKSSLSQAFEIGVKGLDLAIRQRNDSLAVEFYLLLGKNLSFQGKNAEALPYFEKALACAKKKRMTKGECASLLEIGILNYDWGHYDEALEYFTQALKLAETKNLTDLEALANNYIGKYYHTVGKFSTSVEYYKKSDSLYQQAGNLQQSATVLLSIGKTYMNEGNFHKALDCYLDAYKKSEIVNDKITFSDVCNHLGTIYLLLNQPDKSLEYHRKAFAIRSELGNLEGIAKSGNNIGETFLHILKPDSALIYFNQSLELCTKTGYKKGTVKALTNIGISRTLKKEYKEGYNYLEQSYSIASKAGYDAGIAESSLALGNNLLAQKRYEEAVSKYLTSLNKATSSNLSEVRLMSNKGLYNCYLELNNFPMALKYHAAFTELEKKKLQAEYSQQLAELKLTFESEKKEKDIEYLRKENELNEMSIKRKSALMWLFMIALALAVSLCIIIYTRFESKNRANKELKTLNSKILEQNRELDKLNKELEIVSREKDKIFSIIAHELRNPLFWFQNLAEVLSAKFLTMSPEKMKKSLTALDESAKNAFHLMDNLLHWSRSRLNRITPKISPQPLDKLIFEATRMYNTIIQQKDIELVVEIPEGVVIKADPDLFTCVIRNLVSNSVKYTHPRGFIHISCLTDQPEIKIRISDSGIGIPDKQLVKLFDNSYSFSNPGLMNEQGSGLGLKLCKEFIELNGGKIWVNSEDGKGTRFEFTVPKYLNGSTVLC